jgi:acetyltransferase-like isoleucine patch superfamily enzyme
MIKKEYVVFDRPSKREYLIQIITTVFSLTFIKHVLSLFAYYIINYVRGKKIAHIGKNTKEQPTVILRQAERVFIGENCLLNHNNVLQGGKKTGKIIIGNHVHCGANVMMFAFNHGTDSLDIPTINQDYYDGDIIIEDDVWIGAGSVILPGIKIGKGVVIASNSVVNKDVASYTIVGGVPAKQIKERT